METTTVELQYGFVDATGTAHKSVTLRVPVMRDEIAAERATKKAGFDTESAYFECAFLIQCITDWGGIASVSVDHVLDLGRADARTLRLELAKLEARDQETQASKNSPGGED